MQLHANAKSCPRSRRLLVDRVLVDGWPVREAAQAAGISERSAYRWLVRWRREGERGLADRSSRPKTSPNKTAAERERTIAALRRLRMTAAEIAELLGMALSTVSAVLKRIGLGKRSRLEPPEPPNRYERRRPGELIHTDIKKLGRIKGGAGKRITGRRRHHQLALTDAAGRRRNTAGWDFVHIAIDDHSRLAYAEVLADETGQTAAGFLRRAIAFFARHGICCERVMTDNGSAYISAAHALACRELGLKHLRTRPYRPRTNGKAERFIQTMLGSWAYGRIYGSSHERTTALPAWLKHYNFTRPHGALSHKPPGSRLTNLHGNYD
jgi:transposase InsO family protein